MAEDEPQKRPLKWDLEEASRTLLAILAVVHTMGPPPSDVEAWETVIMLAEDARKRIALALVQAGT